MYYEEKTINGILHFRTAPKSAWKKCGTAQLSNLLREEKEKVSRLEKALRDLVECPDYKDISTHEMRRAKALIPSPTTGREE